MKKSHFVLIGIAVVVFFAYRYAAHKTDIKSHRSEGLAAGENLSLQRAGNSGDANAKITAATQLIGGYRVARDIPGGIRLYEEAAAEGSATAMYDLGRLYLNGISGGIEADHTKAAFWLKKAADAGHQNAKQAFDQLQSGGYDVPPGDPQ